jgi:hypothetical protein
MLATNAKHTKAKIGAGQRVKRARKILVRGTSLFLFLLFLISVGAGVREHFKFRKQG